jgi:hypothetical protein
LCLLVDLKNLAYVIDNAGKHALPSLKNIINVRAQ